jgi:hypothetical protein
MAAALNTVVGTVAFGNGFVLEYGTWSDAAAASGGDITATSQTAGSPTLTIGRVAASGFTSNGSTAVLRKTAADPKTVTISCTSSEAGTYWLLGPAA